MKELLINPVKILGINFGLLFAFILTFSFVDSPSKSMETSFVLSSCH